MANTLVIINNPADGVTTYQNGKVQRAPDSSGAPGTFADLATTALDGTSETTNYTDITGLTTDWYRYRWENTTATVVSDWSASIQAGDYLIRQWVTKDIPATDISNTDWDRWRDQIILDMNLHGLGRPSSNTLSWTPASNTDYWMNVDQSVKIVLQVDIYNGNQMISHTNDWVQWGRKVWLTQPNPKFTYKYLGVQEIRTLGDMDDELMLCLMWGMRLRYLQKRLTDRGDFRVFLVSDKISDQDTVSIGKLVEDAKKEYESRLVAARFAFVMPAIRP